MTRDKICALLSHSLRYDRVVVHIDASEEKLQIGIYPNSVEKEVFEK